MTPYLIAPVGDHIGEAATWSADEQRLYWTDVNRFLVHRLTPATGAVESWVFDEPCVALAITDRPGTLLLALGSRLILWQPEGDIRADHGFILPDWPAARLNDGRPGPGGELWIGSMANNVGPEGEHLDCTGFRGVLHRIMSDQPVEIVRRELGISNTVCFAPDGRRFYFGDTMRNIIWRYDYDPATRSIAGETPFFEGFTRGLPDGSTTDAEGYLWNCRFGGGCVVRVSPDGQVDRVIDMPVSNPTTGEFGGAERTTLYVTTASILLPRHERFAGALFAIDAGVAGSPGYRFRVGG